jgi:hypothetical protein
MRINPGTVAYQSVLPVGPVCSGPLSVHDWSASGHIYYIARLSGSAFVNIIYLYMIKRCGVMNIWWYCTVHSYIGPQMVRSFIWTVASKIEWFSTRQYYMSCDVMNIWWYCMVHRTSNGSLNIIFMSSTCLKNWTHSVFKFEVLSLMNDDILMRSMFKFEVSGEWWQEQPMDTGTISDWWGPTLNFLV